MIDLYPLLRKILFLFDAETIHEWSLALLSFLQRVRLLKTVLFLLGVKNTPSYSAGPVKVMGLQFPNPVGLAAGLDKNAQHIDALAQCGFGFIEVGTVTPVAQPGNDKPRMFRLQADKAIINRMGFNNKGLDTLLANVTASRRRGRLGGCLIGINIGKNKQTALEAAADDYLICLQKVYSSADYVTVNISSPNTPGLRDLQHGQGLEDLLTRLKQSQSELARQHQRYVPLLVKIAPDLENTEISEIAETLLKVSIDGVIATNTTNQRPDFLQDKTIAKETGGLSGAPLKVLADDVLKKLVKLLDGRIPVIAVGGIMSAADARKKFELGASLIQVYSGFIYQGPSLPARILRSLD